MVIWTKPAQTDLRSIHDYIAHNSKYYAKKVAQDIREKTDILDQLPEMGKTVAEMDNANLRELSLYSYRIIYEIRDTKIFILAIVHKRCDLTSETIKQRDY